MHGPSCDCMVRNISKFLRFNHPNPSIQTCDFVGITCGVAKHSFDPCSNILVEANIARGCKGLKHPLWDWFQHESELYKFHLTILIIASYPLVN